MRVGIRALAVTAGLASLGLGTAAIAAPAASATTRTPTAVHHAGMKIPAHSSTRVLSDGVVLHTIVGKDGAVLRAAGLGGGKATLSATAHGVAGGIKSTGSSKVEAHPGTTLYEQALAVGDSPAQAAKIVKNFGLTPPTSATTAAKTQPSRTPAKNIFNSGCANADGDKSSGYDEADSQTCIVQSYLQNVPGQVYVENSQQTTGDDTLHPLTMLLGDFAYDNGYTYTRVVKQPDNDLDHGSPITITLSPSMGGFSIGSLSFTMYPQKIDLYYPNGEPNAAFGTDWNGSNTGDNVATDDRAEIHNGTGSPSSTNIWVAITWS